MSKFQFSLEKVLHLRKFEEEQAKIELGKAIANTERIKQNLDYVAEERVKSNDKRSQNCDINFLRAIENYITGLDIQKENLLHELSEAELIVEEKRKLMTEAMQKRKTLEKLKEKQYEYFKTECKHKENKILDEIGSTRHKKKSES